MVSVFVRSSGYWCYNSQTWRILSSGIIDCAGKIKNFFGGAAFRWIFPKRVTNVRTLLKNYNPLCSKVASNSSMSRLDHLSTDDESQIGRYIYIYLSKKEATAALCKMQLQCPVTSGYAHGLQCCHKAVANH